MMDIVLGGGMGLLLALLLTNPPRPKVRAVTSKVVEDAPDAKPATGEKAEKKAKKK